jgi:hypothetical protein
VALVVSDVLVHQSPQSFDRIQVRAVGRDKAKLDPTARPAPARPAPASRGGSDRCPGTDGETVSNLGVVWVGRYRSDPYHPQV